MEAGRGKQGLVDGGVAADGVGEKMGGDHGGSHPPFLKTSCHVPVRGSGRKSSDKGKTV